MQCKHEWNREFIDHSCTKLFRNGELKTHREQILFEREKCFLPEAQEMVVRRKKIVVKREEIANVYKLIHELRGTIDHMEIEIYHLQTNRTVTERKEFIRKCPVDECRGFLSTRWKCDVCDNHICAECNEIKGEEHVCDQSAVETMKLLKKDTKPCPSCGTMIFKISGCAQMWCPSCHSAFDWNTMRIETGIVHNPHFYDFQRQNGGLARNPHDVPCGGLPDIMEIQRMFRGVNRFTRPTDPNGATLFNIHRLVVHINNVENIPEEPANTMDLRVGYLMKELEEDEFKKKLQQLEKRREKKRDIRNILTMFSQTCSEIFRQLIAEPEKVADFIKILVNLKTYTNETFANIQKRYACKAPMISDVWDFV